MTLSAGSRLGPYEILSLLGEGGMGEVYRARDTRLGREVAVKVLPEDFAHDSERLRRFEGEARAASALSDPHIVMIHDVGEQNGIYFFASELVEGSDLRRLIDRGPVPLKKALDLAEQIASGLAAAHEKGIVHRDLKPENILITKAGLAKIADFGLAKVTESKERSVSQLPTIEGHQTSAGVVMGTVAYMSPEQAQGRAVDFRSDQFAFGTILFEMLAGRRPFGGGSSTETLASILRDEPEPLEKAAPAVPAPVRWIIERCLAKEPEDRYASTKDLARDLESLSLRLSEPTSTAIGVESGTSRGRTSIPPRALVGAATLAAGLGLLFGVRSIRHVARSPRSLRFTLSFPVDAALFTGNTNSLALTPDGKSLVYVGLKGEERKLFVRSIERDETREIPGSDYAHTPFVSPDGRWVAFFAEGKLKKASLAGGAPIELCDVRNPRGGSWGPDGTIVFAPATDSGLYRIPASGGEPRAVTRPDSGKGELHYHPDILPDGDNVLFQICSPDRPSKVALVSLRTGAQGVLVEDAAYPRYLPSGHLLFTRRGLLCAAPFNPGRLETTGPPAPVLQDVLTNRYGMQYAELSFSREGTLVYVPHRPLQRTLVWVDRRGAADRISLPPAGYAQVSLSPDEERLAAVSVGKAEVQSLLIGDFSRGTLTPSPVEGKFLDPAWTPDGTRIAFGFAPEGHRWWRVFWVRADGSAPAERLGSEVENQQESPASFSPDGSAVLIQFVNYARNNPAANRWGIFPLLLAGERKPAAALATGFEMREARISPDGGWVAYYSGDSGRNEIYVQPYPGPGPRWQISTDGGYYPRWSRNGRELVYRQGDKMMAVDVEVAPKLRAGRPHTLFEGRYFQDWFWETNSYDVSRDGTRFLMIQTDPAESGPPQLNVVLDWFDEVKRRVSGGG